MATTWPARLYRTVRMNKKMVNECLIHYQRPTIRKRRNKWINNPWNNERRESAEDNYTKVERERERALTVAPFFIRLRQERWVANGFPFKNYLKNPDIKWWQEKGGKVRDSRGLQLVRSLVSSLFPSNVQVDFLIKNLFNLCAVSQTLFSC